MIDTDKFPDLPKFGKVLNKYFIKTYRKYKKAILYLYIESSI